MSFDDVQKELMTLKRRRGVIKGSLTRIRNFIKDFNPRERPISLLEFRQDELPQINKKFDDVQSQIELMSSEFEQDEEERNIFETEYFNLRSQIQELVNMEKSNISSGSHNSSIGATCAPNHARLAPISIPTFDGNIQEWESFYDCFNAMVHMDDSYSKSQKFYYLRTSLKGQALEMVKSIPMTDANYDIVIKRLKQRYDNKSLVIQSHIRALIDSPRVEFATSSDLLRLHSHVSAHLAALKALNQPTDQWDAWLVTIITSRLDVTTAQGWQLSCQGTELPKYEEMERFLIDRCTAIETSEAWLTETGEAKGPNTKKAVTNSNAKKALTVVEAKSQRTCVCCSGDHRLYQCNKFKELTSSARLTLARKFHLCFNCLGPFHSADSCRSKFSCRQCKHKHNSLLHIDKENEDRGANKAKRSASLVATSVSPEPTSLSTCNQNSHVFLATALILVRDNSGIYRECRAILDSGSQINFISKKLKNMLQLPSRPTRLPISGIGASTTQSGACVELKVKSRVKSFCMNMKCYVLPVIVNELPYVSIPSTSWTIPSDLSANLADPRFYQSGPIDLLVGCGIFFELLETERVSLDIDRLSLQDSKFGWIVTGEVGTVSLLSVGQEVEEDWLATRINTNSDFGRSSRSNQRSIEEQEAALHFQKHTVRNNDGRFIVRLPVKDTSVEVGSSLPMATSRFFSLEKRLSHDSYLKEEYTKFMSEYINLGHMQEVQTESSVPKNSWYLPHHAVIKISSLTTKVRVVFDASARGSNGLSLNDILMCGPIVQENIFTILTRFRKYQYALTSDVEKMYRQVLVSKEDWDLQRILWRANPWEPLRTYHLTTVTYGTTPASFLATQCLIALSEENEYKYPKAAEVIRNDFYMDDLITGADTVEECCQLQQDISLVMDSAKLHLRKWCSNSKAVLHHAGRRVEDPLFTLEVKDGESVKSLGLEWQPTKDQFQFTRNKMPTRTKFTKRTLLSDLNRVFDPLGFISPVLVKGKIFLQQIWAMQSDWDSTLPQDIQDRWMSFCRDLEQLQDIAIPRKVKPEISEKFQIHGFSDASQEAYGACLYVRSRNRDGKWYARLLCSKTRVAPLRGSTIPRLELKGALLLAELASKVANSWSVDMESFWFWTDSTIVLGWLNAQKNRFKTYVANRISQILNLTKASQWHHVRTEENPADLASRGLSSNELCTSDSWWYGPRWLVDDDRKWDLSTELVMEEKLPEKRKIKLALVSTTSCINIINIKSDWNKILRLIAWLSLFVEYLRAKKNIEVPDFLTVTHLKRAEIVILKQVQSECFQKEIDALKRGEEVPRGSKLRTLYPFLKDGILLVGGRLQNADISDAQKHPIILPSHHRVTRLIFENTHRQMLHCGPQALLAQIRRKYWPLLGRLIARAVVRKCVKCVRASPRFHEPIMAPLPKDRVQISRPFSVTGVDFTGPFIIRSGIRRVTGKKSWIAVFVCFSSRAVHLEVVEDMTSNAFLACLRRFMARRGRCSIIYSDNGTNFLGAQRELNSIVKKSGEAMAQEGIEWKFNPPSSPHFGGLWEAAVKSAKYHLKRVMGETKLTLAELNTLICQVEACLNSRPITPMGNNPDEPEALTPAHFLVGGSLCLPPDVDMIKEAPGSLRRWKHIQYLLQLFWRRWHSEYLPQCQIRGKWVHKKRQLKVNDIVIIKEDCLLPTKWKLGRITQVHPGRDNVIRVVTVRTSSGNEIKRPAVKLCLLPTDSDSNPVENDNFQRGENVDAN